MGEYKFYSEELKKDKLCFYCLGCMRLENKEFLGTRNCKNFVAFKENWEKEFIEGIKEEAKKC